MSVPATVKHDGYSRLLKQVEQVLIKGQRRLEEERVKIYLETGQLIQKYILKHKDRAQYGAEVIKHLARDIGVSETVLHRCFQFAQKYPRLPIFATGQKFSWSHYRQLITFPDDKKRLSLEKAIAQNEWSVEELAARIKKDQAQKTKIIDAKMMSHQTPLVSLRGTPYTYRIVERPNVKSGQSALRIDLGFGIFHRVDSRLIHSFSKGDIIQSQPKDDAYKFIKTDRTVKDLFTYWAEVEKIIDGDTLKVRFDLGFEMEVRDTLRLRGIDCPEMDTKEGEIAKAFVQSYIKEAQTLIVRSSRSDKYDRYLADIFIPLGEEPDPATDIYLNNLLLEQGHAKRWEG